MHTFTDCKDREWKLEMTLGLAEKIEAEDFSAVYDNPVSILDPDEHFFTLGITNTPLLFSMVWLMVEGQHEGVDINEFKNGINGETIAKVKEAFWGCLIDFFPEKKTALSGIIQRFKEVMKRADTDAAATIASPKVTDLIDQEFKKANDKALDHIGDQSG